METLLGIVLLDSLTYQSRRYFILPWHKLPNGTIRFIDRGFLGRQVRIMLGTLPLAAAVLFFYLGLQPLLDGRSQSRVDSALCVGGVLAIAAAGILILPWARTRTIDVDPDGVATIRDHSPSRPPPPTRPRTHLEVRPVRAWAYWLQWQPFGLFISDGASAAALCFALTPEGCLNALSDMPEQVRRIPLVEADHAVISTIHWT